MRQIDSAAFWQRKQDFCSQKPIDNPDKPPAPQCAAQHAFTTPPENPQHVPCTLLARHLHATCTLLASTRCPPDTSPQYIPRHIPQYSFDEMMDAMKRWHKQATFALVLALLLITAGVVYLRSKTAPEVAQLLPNSDGIVYLDLTPLRVMTHLGRHPVKPGPDYQKFIDATGIVFERDLDQAAFALTVMPNPNGPNGAIAYSEVFEGHFNRLRLAHYLAHLASSEESYRGKTIYRIANDGRTDRVAILNHHLVAVSNTPTEAEIHSIIDRDCEPFWKRTRPTLLTSYYKEVPALSLVWGIGRARLLLGAKDTERLTWLNHLFGAQLLISPETPLIASVRWTGDVQLRVEEIAPSSDEAAASATALRAGLKLAQMLEGLFNHGPQQASIKALLTSAQVAQQGDRTILTAKAPRALLEHLFDPTPAQPHATIEP